MRRVTDIASRRARGVTLVEMIIAIVITGILVAMVAMFGRWQILSYFDVANRNDLTDAADTALRRMARDLQAALPNSVRVDATGKYLEFTPIKDAGRYRAATTPAGTGNILDFTNAADTSFDVLGPPVTIAGGDQLVIYNLGQAGATVYSGSDTDGDNRRSANAGTGLATVTFTNTAAPFPFASPQNRFHIVGSPVTYWCDAAAAAIRRYSCYAFQVAQPTAFTAAHGGCAAVQSTVLVAGVDCAQSSFSYAPGALQRNGLVSMRLTLAGNGETVSLLHQVDVLNSP